MPSRPWFPLYPSHYLADTAFLSVEAHGVYLLLLQHLWLNDNSLPYDFKQLSRLLRADVRRIKRIFSEELSDKFVIEDGQISNPRIGKELSKTIEIQKKRREAGRIGGQANAKANASPNAQANAQPNGEAVNNNNNNILNNGESDDSATATKFIFDVGLKLLTEAGNAEQSARSFLGKHIKANPEKLTEVISYLQAHPKIEPKAYIEQAMKPKPRKVAL